MRVLLVKYSFHLFHICILLVLKRFGRQPLIIWLWCVGCRSGGGDELAVHLTIGETTHSPKPPTYVHNSCSPGLPHTVSLHQHRWRAWAQTTLAVKLSWLMALSVVDVAYVWDVSRRVLYSLLVILSVMFPGLVHFLRNSYFFWRNAVGREYDCIHLICGIEKVFC